MSVRILRRHIWAASRQRTAWRSATWEGIATPEGGITPVGYVYRELAAGGVGTERL